MSNLAPLCPPCADLRMRWLDYRLPRTLSITYGSGAAHDITVEGVKDRQRARYESWRTLIREQRDAIASSCRAAGHTSGPVRGPAPAVVQLDLLTMLESQGVAA